MSPPVPLPSLAFRVSFAIEGAGDRWAVVPGKENNRIFPEAKLIDGIYDFTPWYKISDSCTSNCSFVSGDAAVGFLLIIFYFITKKNVYLYLGLITGSCLGFIRIVAGGHFFSDIVFSQIVVTTSISMSFILYKKLYDK